MPLYIELGRLVSADGENVLSMLVESPTESRCPVQLLLSTFDGSGGGGGNSGTLSAPSVEGAIDSMGNLWLFGAISKSCSKVERGGVVGHLFRQQNMSLDFYLIDVGASREGELTFYVDDLQLRRPFKT